MIVDKIHFYKFAFNIIFFCLVNIFTSFILASYSHKFINQQSVYKFQVSSFEKLETILDQQILQRFNIQNIDDYTKFDAIDRYNNSINEIFIKNFKTIIQPNSKSKIYTNCNKLKKINGINSVQFFEEYFASNFILNISILYNDRENEKKILDECVAEIINFINSYNLQFEKTKINKKFFIKDQSNQKHRPISLASLFFLIFSLILFVYLIINKKKIISFFVYKKNKNTK